MFARVTIIFLLLFTHQLHAQKNWELAKTGEGIKVYTKKDAGARFKSIRVEATIHGTMDKLLKILMDAGSNKDWVYATNESYIIRQISPLEAISYTETSVPWPASNRDVPLHLQLIPNAQKTTLKVIAKGLPKAIPEKNGIVRIPYFDSWWDVKYDGKEKLDIVYFLEMDPGGAVPAWLVNMFIARGPYETFSGLARLMK